VTVVVFWWTTKTALKVDKTDDGIPLIVKL
jgi:hypothetical protein